MRRKGVKKSPQRSCGCLNIGMLKARLVEQFGLVKGAWQGVGTRYSLGFFPTQTTPRSQDSSFAFVLRMAPLQWNNLEILITTNQSLRIVVQIIDKVALFHILKYTLVHTQFHKSKSIFFPKDMYFFRPPTHCEKAQKTLTQQNVRWGLISF